MKIDFNRYQKNPIYYLAKTVYIDGKSKTINVERLGYHNDLLEKYDDPLKSLREYAKQKTKEEKEGRLNITNALIQSKMKKEDIQTGSNSLNVGYLYLNEIYKKLNLDKFFKAVTKDSKIKYNPDIITKFLTFGRILDPKSKKSTYDNFNTYYEHPKASLQELYKTMDLINEYNDEFQAHIYNNSSKISKRNTDILYYDCTNFFFEIEEEDNFRKYGISKENRPNPIVGLGLFMDADGIPLSFTSFPGNINEQQTLIPLQKKITKDFKLSKYIFISDAGLGSNKNKFYNSIGERDFIVTQSIKGLDKANKDIIFKDDYWYLMGDSSNKMYSMTEIKELELKGLTKGKTFYKDFIIDKPINLGLKSRTEKGKTTHKTSFKQRIIVTYQTKYAAKQRSLRLKQVERAYKIVKSNSQDRVSQTSPKRFIKTDYDGKNVDINIDKIFEEAKYDGLYAVVTSLMNDDVKSIFKASSNRWKIEETFRVMKSTLKTRPIYHSREDRIKAHFSICFLSLLVIRLFEKKADLDISTEVLIKGLRETSVLKLNEAVFLSIHKHNELVNKLDKVFNKELKMNMFTNTQLNKMI